MGKDQFNKGGSKFTDGEFLQPTLKRSWPNKREAAKAFRANVFALVEYTLEIFLASKASTLIFTG